MSSLVWITALVGGSVAGIAASIWMRKNGTGKRIEAALEKVADEFESIENVISNMEDMGDMKSDPGVCAQIYAYIRSRSLASRLIRIAEMREKYLKKVRRYSSGFGILGGTALLLLLRNFQKVTCERGEEGVAWR